MKYMKYFKILLISFIIVLFSGCAVVDRGNFSTFSTKDSRSYHSFHSYKTIDTSKEDIGIPTPPHTPIVVRFEARDGECAGKDCMVNCERYELEEQRARIVYEGNEFWSLGIFIFQKTIKL